MGRKVSEHIQNSKADVTQYKHTHAKQMTNTDHVKEFGFEILIITIHEVVKIL